MKQLFWKDKTGRGFSNTQTFEDIQELENEEDWHGELLHEWVKECKVGYRWENLVSEITCVEKNHILK